VRGSNHAIFSGKKLPGVWKGAGADLKRAIAAGLVFIMLLYMATVSASSPGSSADPLITQSYLEGRFSTTLRADVSKSLGGAADSAINKLDEVYRDYVGYDFAPRFTPVTLTSGGTLFLASGASFILLSGSASLAVSSGTVINISTGSEVKSGSQLTRNQRYFCTEETRAAVTASSAARGHVDGYYFTQGATVAPRPLPFVDVPTNAWFFPAIEFVYKNELFSGTGAATFSPGSSMTRGMFVTVLYRLHGSPDVVKDETFSDVVNPALYYYNAVIWASSLEIVKGYADGTFKPERSVTREEMAVFMHRYASSKTRNMSVSGDLYDSFTDKGAVSAFAVDAMRWAVSREVIRGSGGKLNPQSTATRAEVAQIIFNYCEKIGR